MPFMQWSEMLTIDGAFVDQQHQGLFAAVNAFYDAVAAGDEAGLVAQTLDLLHVYGLEHFTAEEAMLERHAYPNLDQHRRQHRLFLDQIMAFRSQLISGGSGLGHSMSQFLGSWLVNHIMVADKAYASFLRGSVPQLAIDGEEA
jgi:hemerythrin-like metal-binding protein